MNSNNTIMTTNKWKETMKGKPLIKIKKENTLIMFFVYKIFTNYYYYYKKFSIEFKYLF